MCIMKELWDDSEYANLQLTSRNLRDQASRLETTLGNVTELIVNNLGAVTTKGRQQEQRMESENLDLMAGNESKGHQQQWKICIWSVHSQRT